MKERLAGWTPRAAQNKKEPGSRLPAAASCLGRHAHPAGRSPNSSSPASAAGSGRRCCTGLVLRRLQRRRRSCSNPPLRVKLEIPDKTKNQRIFYAGLFGGRGWISRAAHLKKPRRGFFARRTIGGPYELRLPLFLQPLGRALKKRSAAPASPPCFRRRRRSAPLLFESTRPSEFSFVSKTKTSAYFHTLRFFGGAKQPKSEPLPSGASLAAISSKVMVFVPSL